MIIDILLLLVFGLAIYKGWTKGFIMSIFVFISYLIALALALYFSGYVEGYIRSKSPTDSNWFPLLSFLLVLVAGIIGVRLIGKIIEKSAEVLLLGFANKGLGIILFTLIYCTLFSVVLVYLQKFDLLGKDATAGSKTFSYLDSYGRWLVARFSDWIPAIKNLFNETKEAIQQKSTLNVSIFSLNS